MKRFRCTYQVYPTSTMENDDVFVLLKDDDVRGKELDEITAVVKEKFEEMFPPIGGRQFISCREEA